MLVFGFKLLRTITLTFHILVMKCSIYFMSCAMAFHKSVWTALALRSVCKLLVFDNFRCKQILKVNFLKF